VAVAAVLSGARLALQAQAGESAAARAQFARGLTALHHFEYEDANEAFQRSRQTDPRFVMAYWGEAMTYHQTLWRRENVAAARAALARLGPSPAARAARAATALEKGYIEAVDVLFGDGDPRSRQQRYAAAMQHLHERFPDDPDVAAFFALARLGTVSRSLIGFTGVHDGHDRELAGSDAQNEIAAALERVLASHPEHPGALHYLLHTYDDPDHARLALGAARTYAGIAAGASHALHMPAHVFLQLGLWHDAEASDLAAYEASVARARRRGLDAADRNYHALTWHQYELLQLGRYGEAKDSIGAVEAAIREVAASVGRGPALDDTGHQPLQSDRSSMRARYVIETRQWKLMANERNFGNVDELLAIGLSAARSNNLDLAEHARTALAERTRAEQEGDLRPAIAIMEREVAAQMAAARGGRTEAIAILEAAARDENALPAPLGLPTPAKPAPELLGEMLLEAGRPQDAREAFEHALRRHANRSLSVLGLARAATALGDVSAARRLYSELLARFDRADAELPELAEARNAIARFELPDAVSPPRSMARLWILTAFVSGLLIVFMVARRRRAFARPPGTQRIQKRKS